MRGMRVISSELETANLRDIKAGVVSTPLARIQQGFFDKQAAVDHNIPGTNLYITKFGRDINGNPVVYVTTPNQRAIAIQTDGNLPKTYEVGRHGGMSFFSDATQTEITEVEQEVLAWVQQYEKGSIKNHLKVYDKGEEPAKPRQGDYLTSAKTANVSSVEHPKKQAAKYRAEFVGTEVGALGVASPITTEVEGEDEEQAELALYDRYEHIRDLKLTKVGSVINKTAMICHQCGGEFTIDAAGVAQHLTDDGEIDYDKDEDHVPYELFDEITSQKKTAAIYDGYGYRLTIESRAGDNNENTSAIRNALKSLDIRYRIVRACTVDPDRVMMDVLITKEDATVVRELAKEIEKDGIIISFNDNISEALKPRQIVTPEKEVAEDLPKSK